MQKKSRKPELTVREMFRLSHAFHGGSRFKEGQEVFVVMSREAPLYRVQGTYATEAEARAALKEKPKGWSKGELGKRAVFPVDAPPQQFDWNGKLAPPNFGDIEWLQLRVKVKNGPVYRYELPTTTDMITLTPAAYHVFLYRYYLDHFGRRYADRRLRMASGKPATGASARSKAPKMARSSTTSGVVSRAPYSSVMAHNEFTEDAPSSPEAE
jgi:hypothetical protein